MQARPYPSKSGKRLWLSHAEQEKLLSLVEDEYPRRRIALDLALHGLRSDEVRNVKPRHFQPLDDNGKWRLTIPDGKTGTRDVPAELPRSRAGPYNLESDGTSRLPIN
ncbi:MULTISPECIES: hypothetical protein [Haloferax]|uniref:Phage integrase n=1 Tax=Haloferax mediterranei (strain ATCC 33500 / DSM 1411 / JCM 8866 / NBRC 14739 / NCIMB 2177 / R-4) TaxID=523841 RepID=M0ISQ6_HALMT|nr:hypothetical protein [Haloferax mediterranei]ELZ99047.1 putative phage integrase [Haloferax mediterranei ATCC 33500]MDX5987057.1 hypothetical protein [Haloferax mediterranei ATCC 33500]